MDNIFALLNGLAPQGWTWELTVSPENDGVAFTFDLYHKDTGISLRGSGPTVLDAFINLIAAGNAQASALSALAVGISLE